MSRSTARSLILGVLVLGIPLPTRAQDGTPPRMTAPAEMSPADDPADLLREDDATPAPFVEPPAHEAFRAMHPPPAPITERPNSASPDPKAVWIKGYWEWDDARQDFAWAVGGWRVPPPGKVWVDGAWKQDEKGWYRVPGSWADSSGVAVDWRQDGPPADHPADIAGPAPAPGMFYIAGIYVPDGDRLAWKPGFWAKAQPGWEWFPARWVRRADGWSFRPGSWQAEGSGNSGAPFSSSPDDSTTPVDRSSPVVRHDVARPVQGVTDLQPLPDDRRTQQTSRLTRPEPAETAETRTAQALAPRTAASTGPVSTGTPPAIPATSNPSYIMVLPDGRRVSVAAPGYGGPSDPRFDPYGEGPTARGPAPRRNPPLFRPLFPQLRDQRRRPR